MSRPAHALSRKLDGAIPAGQFVRTVWELLQKSDWKFREDRYVLYKGHPPIHTSILVVVILYGLLTSRAFEEALEVRMGFRWLAEGRSIDYSTIAKFRTAYPDRLPKVVVQLGVIVE